MKTSTTTNPGALLDAAIGKLGLNSDSALSRALGVAAPTISKIRNGGLPVGSSMVLRLHDIAGMDLGDIRRVLGTEPYRSPLPAPHAAAM
jgi:plasmid maintenance system antidote protein VapI